MEAFFETPTVYNLCFRTPVARITRCVCFRGEYRPVSPLSAAVASGRVNRTVRRCSVLKHFMHGINKARS